MLKETKDTCVMCGKAISKQTEILEIIDGTKYAFDNKDCILFFKKFKSIYGASFG